LRARVSESILHTRRAFLLRRAVVSRRCGRRFFPATESASPYRRRSFRGTWAATHSGRECTLRVGERLFDRLELWLGEPGERVRIDPARLNLAIDGLTLCRG